MGLGLELGLRLGLGLGLGLRLGLALVDRLASNSAVWRCCEVRPDRMRPKAPPYHSTFLALHTPHLCIFLGFLCGQEGEISPNMQVVVLCACVWANFFQTAPVFAQDRGSDDSPPALCQVSYNSRLS